MASTTVASSRINNPAFLSMSESERAKFEEGLKGLTVKIETWSHIALKHGIDISEEQAHLAWLKRDVKTVKTTCPEAIGTLRHFKAQRLLASRIVKKVKRDLHHEVEEDKVEKVQQELHDFTTKTCIPWVRQANAEQVDCKEEISVMNFAIVSEMELLSKASNFQKEVIFRRQLVTRKVSTSRIVQKVYRRRINYLADTFKAKDWFCDERQQVVEGIRIEAIRSIPVSSDPKGIIEVSQRLFDLYRANLELFDEHPELYHQLADREVFVRSVDLRARHLSQDLDSNSPLRTQIERMRVAAHELLRSEGYSDELVERVDTTFNSFEERISGSRYNGCGFGK